MIRIGIVEDSAPYRKRIGEFIDSSEDVRCVCACETGAAALERLPGSAPDVVLMDLRLPDCSGSECTEQLKRRMPSTQFMIFTVNEDGEEIFRALKAGASGYLLKRTPPEAILAAIRDLHQGGAPMNSEIARKVVSFFQKKSDVEDLSPRQKEILKLLSQGYITKEIADKMGLSVETVRSYLKLVYQKLHVNNRAAAVMKVFG